MSKIFKELVTTLGKQFPLIRPLSSRRPVILMYHDVPRGDGGHELDGESFERQILYLKSNVELISPDDLEQKRPILNKIQVLLTFDDGFRNNAEVVAPVLRKYHVPAVFFVSSRHVSPGKYLWFSYLKMLEKHFRGNGFTYRGEFMDMSILQRSSTIKRLKKHLLELDPHPVKMYEVIEHELPGLEDFIGEDKLNDYCAGMTIEQVEELSHDPLFTIGAHTVDHPFLTKCDSKEVLRQIADNKMWIEKITGRRCNLIAYPAADYHVHVLERCRDLGFAYGYSVERNLGYDSRYELQRVGIYSRSINEVRFKVQWGNLVRSQNLNLLTSN